MKLVYPLLFMLLTFQHNAFTQSCASSVLLPKGKTWTVSNYNKKDKFTGKVKRSVIVSKQEGNKYIWEIEQKTYDKKEELINTSVYTITCENGDFEVEATGLVPSETLEMLENLESSVDVEMKQNTINYPTSKRTDFKLKNGSVEMKAKAYGMLVINLTVSVLDRKIVGLETIETDAGSFECVKINQTLQIKDKRKEKNHPTVIWYLPGFGPIRSELYSPNGKLMEYSVVSSISG